MVLSWWLRCNKSILIYEILHTKISPFLGWLVGNRGRTFIHCIKAKYKCRPQLGTVANKSQYCYPMQTSPFPCVQGGTCGNENCDGRGLMYCAWPIRVGWVAGSELKPIWLTNAGQLRSAHPEPGCQSNPPQSARVTCGSSVKSVFWIWSLRPGCSKVSWDLWNGTDWSFRSYRHWFGL